MDLGRDYSLFSLLAKVRGDSDEGFDPKGIPKDISWRTEGDYTLPVTDKDDSYGVSKKVADEWVKTGASTRFNTRGVPERVSSPDWHSASWLTADEIKKVLKIYEHTTLKAIYHMMKAYEADKYEARLVFWFDN